MKLVKMENDNLEEVHRNINGHCPRTQSKDAEKFDACVGFLNQEVYANAPKSIDSDLVVIVDIMNTIKHKIIVYIIR